MTTIIVFASSLSITAILVLVKAIELKFGKKNTFLELISRLDNKALSLITEVKFRNLQLIQTIRYIVLVQSKDVFRSFLDKLQEKIALEYRLRQELVMGKRNITNRGSVSFYLKKITEEKGMEKGKIE
jgi:hypothetical protein